MVKNFNREISLSLLHFKKLFCAYKERITVLHLSYSTLEKTIPFTASFNTKFQACQIQFE